MNSNNIIKYLSNKDNLLFLGLAIIMLLSIYLKYNKNIEGFSGNIEKLEKEKKFVKGYISSFKGYRKSAKESHKKKFDKEYFVEYKKYIKLYLQLAMLVYKEAVYDELSARRSNYMSKDDKQRKKFHRKSKAAKEVKERSIKEFNTLMEELKILNALNV